MTEQHFTEQTKALIDSLKTICAHYGLGNDGNEFKIITQAFLYKFLIFLFVHSSLNFSIYNFLLERRCKMKKAFLIVFAIAFFLLLFFSKKCIHNY